MKDPEFYAMAFNAHDWGSAEKARSQRDKAAKAFWESGYALFWRHFKALNRDYDSYEFVAIKEQHIKPVHPDTQVELP